MTDSLWGSVQHTLFVTGYSPHTHTHTHTCTFLLHVNTHILQKTKKQRAPLPNEPAVSSVAM